LGTFYKLNTITTTVVQQNTWVKTLQRKSKKLKKKAEAKNKTNLMKFPTWFDL